MGTILLLPLVAMNVCIWRMFVFMSAVITVCDCVMIVVWRPLIKIVVLTLEC